MKQSGCGYQIEISDSSLQAFLQEWPFLSSPDAEKNKTAAQAVLNGLHQREEGVEPRRVLLSQKRSTLSEEEMTTVLGHFDSLQLDKALQRRLIDDFAWEANMVPRGAKNVLVVGCGNGIEMIFLRVLLPEARFTAVNYVDCMAPAVKEIVKTTLYTGDMHSHFESLEGGYDLVTSNHTLEHMYVPDKTLSALFRLLAPGGVLISTLPMDGTSASPFVERIRRAAETKKIHPVDFVFLDAGHPWKTNPADLNHTLLATGFSDVTLYQRAGKITRQSAGSKLKLAWEKRIGLLLHTALFWLPHAFGQLLPAGKLQTFLTRALYSIERRFWFGSNSLKNRYTEETLFYATKPIT